MSQMMNNPFESTDEEDRESLKSTKKSPGLMKTFRGSIRLKSGRKGSEVTDATDLGSPLSPGLSPGSPLKRIGSLFLKKEEDDTNGASPKRKIQTNSWIDPNMSRFVGAIKERGTSFRRSLRYSSKRVKALREGAPASNEEEEEGKKAKEEEEEKKAQEQEEVAEVCEEVEESYTLPELPHTPLSVMQISKLIEMEVLEEAHLNLLSLRLEFQQDCERCGGDSSMELAKKEKDLSLLYGDLRNKLNTIVCNSNSLPSRNKGLLVVVSRIIQEEEKRAEEPGGLPTSWMEAWREAVARGVQQKVEAVHLEQSQQNKSWLAVHLGLLGKAVVEDLESVKKELRWSYPRSFNVFSSYVQSYHRAVGQHVKKLEQQATELKDLYALLDWIINRYKSERIMGSLSLQPDMKEESTDLKLDGDFLQQLKDKYCCRVREDTKQSLVRITALENEEFWSHGRLPQTDEDFLISQFHMDIWTTMEGNVVHSEAIDAQLKQKVITSCFEELKQFPKMFEAEFRRRCSAFRPQPVWTEYQITYINSFTTLQQHLQKYRDASPGGEEEFSREVKWLITRLLEDLEDQFKEDVKPYLRRMMTRKWLTNDGDFNQLRCRTEKLSEHCTKMKPPHVQYLASQLHYHVVKEYIGQLMKGNYSCKNQKHEKAASKMLVQCAALRDLFVDMESNQEWLHHVGEDLSNVITQKKSTIKDHLQPLVEHYPDFSKKHLAAVLQFRGLLRGREHQLILQRLSELKRTQGSGGINRNRVLFGEMQVTVNTDCLSNLQLFCHSLRPPSN